MRRHKSNEFRNFPDCPIAESGAKALSPIAGISWCKESHITPQPTRTRVKRRDASWHRSRAPVAGNVRAQNCHGVSEQWVEVCRRPCQIFSEIIEGRSLESQAKYLSSVVEVSFRLLAFV